MIQTCSAPQNDHLIFSFMKDIQVGVEKMTRNRRKMIKQTGDSLLLSKLSFQLSALFSLLFVQGKKLQCSTISPSHYKVIQGRRNWEGRGRGAFEGAPLSRPALLSPNEETSFMEVLFLLSPPPNFGPSDVPGSIT